MWVIIIIMFFSPENCMGRWNQGRKKRKTEEKRWHFVIWILHLSKRGCDQFLLFTFCIFNIRLLIFAFLIWIFISSIICSYFESHSCSGWRQNGDQELCLQVKGLLCIGKLQWLLMMMIIWCLCAGVSKMMMMMMIWLVNGDGWWRWWLSDVFVQESESEAASSGLPPDCDAKQAVRSCHHHQIVSSSSDCVVIIIIIRSCHHHHNHQIMSLSFLGKNRIKIIINVIVIGEERSPLAPKR